MVITREKICFFIVEKDLDIRSTLKNVYSPLYFFNKKKNEFLFISSQNFDIQSGL